MDIGDMIVTPWGARFEMTAPGEFIEDRAGHFPGKEDTKRLYAAPGEGRLYFRVGDSGLTDTGWHLADCQPTPPTLMQLVARLVQPGDLAHPPAPSKGRARPGEIDRGVTE